MISLASRTFWWVSFACSKSFKLRALRAFAIAIKASLSGPKYLAHKIYSKMRNCIRQGMLNLHLNNFWFCWQHRHCFIFSFHSQVGTTSPRGRKIKQWRCCQQNQKLLNCSCNIVIVFVQKIMYFKNVLPAAKIVTSSGSSCIIRSFFIFLLQKKQSLVW